MNNKSSDFIALQWLITPLKQEINDIHNAWQSSVQTGDFLPQAKQFHAIGNVLTVANLTALANLSFLLKRCCERLSDGTLDGTLAPKILLASRLLQYEMERFVLTGTEETLLVVLRCQYLERILGESRVLDESRELQTNQSQVNQSRFSDLITIADEKAIQFNEQEQQKINVAWRSASQKLLESNENIAPNLEVLAKIAYYSSKANQHKSPKAIWYLAYLWLSSLALNDKPKPHQYAQLLSQLDGLIAEQTNDSFDIELENLLVDIYVQLNRLQTTTDEAQKMLLDMQYGMSDEQQFFPHILSVLENMLLLLANGEVAVDTLQDIKNQLAKRGWSFYESYVGQIIDDINSVKDDPEAFAQMQWQITTQLQDLYTAIDNTHNAIDNHIGQTAAVPMRDEDSQKQLRRIRILVEEIKASFNSYLYSKNTERLVQREVFDELDAVFVEMGVYDAATIADSLSDLFAYLKNNTPEKISWQFAHALAESLSSLELFLDSLAQEIFDESLLLRAKDGVEKAENWLDASDGAEYQPAQKASNTVRYSDDGEIAPTDNVLDTNNVLEDNALDTDNPQKATSIGGIDNNTDNASTADNTNDDSVNAVDDDDSDNQASLEADNNLSGLHTENNDTADESIHNNEKLSDEKLSDEGLSEAYLAAKAELKPDTFDFDEDIREIFIEEADEVLTSLEALLPTWQADVANLAPLKEIRRGFHTLKGSGRMVGAYSVGEMAWAVENMLNRVLDGTLAPTDELWQFINETTKKLPTLVEDFADSVAPSLDPAVVVLKAKNLLAGKAVNDGVPSQSNVGEMSGSQASPGQVSQNQAQATKTTAKMVLSSDDSQSIKDEQMTNADGLSKNAPPTSELPEVLLPFIENAKAPIENKIDDVDEDIKEIFIEEASEVLEEITPLFASWQNTQNKATLTDIRRGFHTLKGSGRMVGASVLGELAWAVENMLNRVLDGTVAVNEGMIALIDDVLTNFGDLVALFEQNRSDYPDVLVLWIAAAHAYSKGLGDAFDYKTLVAKPALNQLSSDVANDVLQSIKQVGDVLSDAPLTTPDSDEEAMLCQIFIEEAEELLLEVKVYLKAHQNEDAVVVSDSIVRVFHTLRGASGLPPLLAVSEVGEMIETSLQHLQHHDTKMTAKHLQALTVAVELIENHLNYYKNTHQDDHRDEANQHQAPISFDDKQQLELLLGGDTGSQVDIVDLIDGIDALLDAELSLEEISNNSLDEIKNYAKAVLSDIKILKAKTSALVKFQRLLSLLSLAYDVLYHHPEQANDDGFIDALMAGHSELTGLFDSLAGSMSLRLNSAVMNQLDSKLQDIQYYYQGLDEHTLVVSEEAPEPIAYQEVTTDPELLEIFLEEAQELDTAIGEAFAEFKADTSNTDALKALQRHLHTIKGGARLAGISSIGDLTHEAETVYEQMVDGRLKVSAGWVRIMQGVQDILSLQIDELQQNKRTFFADKAVAQLQHFLNQSTVPDDASIVLPIMADEPKASETVTEEQPVETTECSKFNDYQLQSWQGVLPDSDILAVFLEEAEELVESSSEEFQIFRANTSDIAVLQSLQRKLHTIKGGARMVLANGVADLAHHMETVYEDLANRRRPATKMVIQLLLACHDWLAQAMLLLKVTLNPPKPTPLIDALEGFSRRPDSLSSVPVVSLNEVLDMIAAHEAYEKQRRGGRDISRMPPMDGLSVESEEVGSSNEMIRISASLMERMINLSGEAAINRARIDMSMSSLTVSIEEMGVTVQRLADQLRRMDIELEAQILAQIDDDDKELVDSGFDPLEMDQYSSLNQLSKSLSESASDLLDLKATLLEKTRDGENLLLQLSRTQAELQDGLMYSRMVPFSRLTPRLQRIVRQVSSELGKQVELNVVNADDEMDRTILERITSPLEHMLRNAIDHGIEMPDERVAKGKSKTGHISLEVVREGGEILIHLSDDGAGVNVEAVRKKAVSQGLIAADDTSLSDIDIMQYIFNAGLSTTSVVTQISGRGVGMDVVRSEIQQLGGSVSVDSVRHQGSRFTLRVPLTVAVSDTLIVRAADRQYAVPLVQIERVTQVATDKLLEYYQSTDATIDIDGVPYRLRYLNEILTGHNFSELLSSRETLPVILVKNQAGQNIALQTDEIVGSRIEVVVKPLGLQLSHVSGISAATIMGDGSVMFILDLMALVRNARARVAVDIVVPEEKKRPVIMVVDDSVTVRKVTSRFLERQGFEAVVAKDGVDALEILQELTPDLMLLDIEMPRMDGFEVATQVRHNARLKDLPIIMITSRTGEKHRERAFEIGVSDYMGKPFQEVDLLNRISAHLVS